MILRFRSHSIYMTPISFHRLAQLDRAPKGPDSTARENGVSNRTSCTFGLAPTDSSNHATTPL